MLEIYSENDAARSSVFECDVKKRSWSKKEGKKLKKHSKKTITSEPIEEFDKHSATTCQKRRRICSFGLG
jgi:CRISPR/Cas system-associated endoribonuclease Cas2